MGQLEAIGSAAWGKLWAIGRPPAASGGGPTPCHRQQPFQDQPGQFEVFAGSTLGRLWAIALFTTPVLRGAGPIPRRRRRLFREVMGQLEAIGSAAWGKLWAIGRPPAAFGGGPTPCHRQQPS